MLIKLDKLTSRITSHHERLKEGGRKNVYNYLHQVCDQLLIIDSEYMEGKNTPNI